MELFVNKQGLASNVWDIFPEAAVHSREERDNLAFALENLCNDYNKLVAWDTDPELARRNPHHKKHILQVRVIQHLIYLSAEISRYSFHFNPLSYISVAGEEDAGDTAGEEAAVE